MIAAGVQLGATPSTQGGQNKYKIDSGSWRNWRSIFQGMPVQYDSAGGANVDPGYIVTAQSMLLQFLTIGVFNGAFYYRCKYNLKANFCFDSGPGGTSASQRIVNNGDVDSFCNR